MPRVGSGLDTSDMMRHQVDLRLYLDRARRRFTQAQQMSTFMQTVEAVVGQAAGQQPNRLEMERFDTEDDAGRLEGFLDRLLDTCTSAKHHELLQMLLRRILHRSVRRHNLDGGPANKLMCFYCAVDWDGQIDQQSLSRQQQQQATEGQVEPGEDGPRAHLAGANPPAGERIEDSQPNASPFLQISHHARNDSGSQTAAAGEHRQRDPSPEPHLQPPPPPAATARERRSRHRARQSSRRSASRSASSSQQSQERLAEAPSRTSNGAGGFYVHYQPGPNQSMQWTPDAPEVKENLPLGRDLTPEVDVVRTDDLHLQQADLNVAGTNHHSAGFAALSHQFTNSANSANRRSSTSSGYVSVLVQPSGSGSSQHSVRTSSQSLKVKLVPKKPKLTTITPVRSFYPAEEMGTPPPVGAVPNPRARTTVNSQATGGGGGGATTTNPWAERVTTF